jgi:hypothetical protein
MYENRSNSKSSWRSNSQKTMKKLILNLCVLGVLCGQIQAAVALSKK